MNSEKEGPLPKTTKTIQKGKLELGLSYTVEKLPFKSGFYGRLEEALPIFENYMKSLLKDLGSPYFPTNLHLTLVGDQKMKSLNRDYRQKDKTTDVLSFPVYENIRGGDEFFVGAVELGDLFISVPVMKKQAEEFKIDNENEFYHLFVHGFLHLLGFDHEISEAQEKLMEAEEKKLLDKIFKKFFKG